MKRWITMMLPTGKRNRKDYYLCMASSLFLGWILILMFLSVDRSMMRLEESILSFIMNCINGILLFALINVIWFLFCNKAKRINDIGLSVIWAIGIEIIRYWTWFNLVFGETIRSGCIVVPRSPTILEIFIIFIVPLLIGIPKGAE